MPQQKKFHILLNKAIKKGDLETVKKIYELNKSDISLKEKFRFACEGTSIPVLEFLRDMYIMEEAPADRFNDDIKNGLMFLIKKSNSFFFECEELFTNNKYQESKEIFFIAASQFGNIEVVNFYLKEPEINPSKDKNSLMIGLIKKAVVSPNSMKIQKVIDALKNDPRVIATAAENEQYNLLSDDAKEMFLF